jgi:hypothetical protein
MLIFWDNIKEELVNLQFGRLFIKADQPICIYLYNILEVFPFSKPIVVFSIHVGLFIVYIMIESAFKSTMLAILIAVPSNFP